MQKQNKGGLGVALLLNQEPGDLYADQRFFGVPKNNANPMQTIAATIIRDMSIGMVLDHTRVGPVNGGSLGEVRL